MSAVLVFRTRLRPMQEDDLATVLEIETAAYPLPWTKQIFRDCLHVGYNAWVLELDDQIVGYGLMSIAAGEAHILNLCVHPHLQRCGYGGQILKQLLKIAKYHQADTVFLEVRCSNQAAIKLYQQIGFNQVGLRKGYYPTAQKQREDALILALALGVEYI